MKFPKWEEILIIDNEPSLSCWHVMQEYVRRSADIAPGAPLLWSLDHKRPLSSNAINSITKKLLQNFGIPIAHWKAHSTRGAGVLLYKKLGLNSEEVCEIGQWKNPQAFTAHYLRLGAIEKAKKCGSKNRAHSLTPELCGA